MLSLHQTLIAFKNMKMNYSRAFAFFLLLVLATSVFAEASLPQQKGNNHEVIEPNQGGRGGGGGGGRGRGYCRYRRCCGGWNYGRCQNWCCSTNLADADFEVIEPNQRGGGGGGGGYCRYRRCCGGYYSGSCRNWCCSHPVDEVEQAQSIDESSYNGGGGGGYNGGGGHGGGGGGGHGGGGGGGHGGGGGGHGGCKYGCCGGHGGGGGGGGGCRCCGSSAEAKAFVESKGKEEIKN